TRISVSTLYKLAKLYAVDIERFFVGLADPKNNKNLDRNLSKSSNINLLIVEDNPGDEAIIRNTLTCFNNLNILCVHDGIQALNVLKYKTLCDDFPSANIIFLDIFIPKRDGLSILKEIKRDKEIQDIPVIILTSNINQELMNEAYKLGASGYISKSFDYNIFKESITDCIKYWTKAVNLPNRCISG
ncbi:MAG: response regulator, partial [Alphaproteobacteria bacterium]|nr:response regulator [Alphaproteobacteria bacterium]